MDIKGCIFDLDGVIVDTAKYHYLAWRKLANKLGFDFTEEQNERLKGVSRVRSLEILLEIGGKDFDEDTKKNLAAEKNTDYVELISKMDSSEILPGALEFLNACKDGGIKIALGSASKNSITILKNVGILGLFDAIVDGNKVSNAKPDPEVFLKGAEELGLSPAVCVVFEDAEAGVEAGVAGGFKVIGVGSPEILSKADKVIPGFKDVSLEILNF